MNHSLKCALIVAAVALASSTHGADIQITNNEPGFASSAASGLDISKMTAGANDAVTLDAAMAHSPAALGSSSDALDTPHGSAGAAATEQRLLAASDFPVDRKPFRNYANLFTGSYAAANANADAWAIRDETDSFRTDGASHKPFDFGAWAERRRSDERASLTTEAFDNADRFSETGIPPSSLGDIFASRVAADKATGIASLDADSPRPSLFAAAPVSSGTDFEAFRRKSEGSTPSFNKFTKRGVVVDTAREVGSDIRQASGDIMDEVKDGYKTVREDIRRGYRRYRAERPAFRYNPYNRYEKRGIFDGVLKYGAMAKAAGAQGLQYATAKAGAMASSANTGIRAAATTLRTKAGAVAASARNGFRTATTTAKDGASAAPSTARAAASTAGDTAASTARTAASTAGDTAASTARTAASTAGDTASSAAATARAAGGRIRDRAGAAAARVGGGLRSAGQAVGNRAGQVASKVKNANFFVKPVKLPNGELLRGPKGELIKTPRIAPIAIGASAATAATLYAGSKFLNDGGRSADGYDGEYDDEYDGQYDDEYDGQYDDEYDDDQYVDAVESHDTAAESSPDAATESLPETAAETPEAATESHETDAESPDAATELDETDAE